VLCWHEAGVSGRTRASGAPEVGAAGGENCPVDGENAAVLEPDDGVAEEIVLPQVVERLHRLGAHASAAALLGDEPLGLGAALFRLHHVLDAACAADVLVLVVVVVVVLVDLHGRGSGRLRSSGRVASRILAEASNCLSPAFNEGR
jgi:hypothetical protein